MVSDVFLEQLRNACPMEEIARTYVDLKRRGRTYVCNCPFHSEKTPSFTVFPDTQSFYCFGCGAGGDVITFIQQIENLDFMDAVKLLAQNSGMTVPEQGADEKQSRMRKRILAVNRAAANFYYRMLTGSDKRGLQYFIQRHLTTTTIKKYGLGFAPETWDALSRYLLQQGFTEEELLLADVSRRSRRGTLIDTFRNRVIFPIVDLRGNVIGFGGRVLDDSQPKYLNTAQTPVFDKGKNLFSLQFAKNSVTTTLILAEGYMDVIAVHQAGFENVVATLGTAITPDQARKISQYAKTVIIAYDSDAAGQAATQKAMRHFSDVSSVMYIAMGWLCIVAIAPIIHSLSKTSFGWLLAGGIIYTVGGVIYALKIPWFENHWKNFGLHEIFHLFVMGGSLCHMILMFQI